MEDQSTNTKKFTFSDLAPTETLDDQSSYFHALKFALGNPRVKNIALTGPYGAGKSSILASYRDKTETDFVNISLATFGDSKDNAEEPSSAEEKSQRRATLHDIETSILQQLLYSVEPEQLPNSKVERIKSTPDHWPKAMAISAWILAAYVSLTRDWNSAFIEVFSSLALSSQIWFWTPLVLTLAGLIGAIVWALTVSPRLSSIKLSAHGVGIEANSNPSEQGSILSSNLDEIVYYFKATETDLVVFEDLDRFEIPEIFHKLREINKLVNDSRAKQKPVRFIYAIRDDLFADADRTKFFDFIVPVIPVVNSSNSAEKFRQLLKEIGAPLGEIRSEFLDTAGYFSVDLRMLTNLVNEYQIYLDNLVSEGLDHTKLLASLLYKNYYPEDFEQLHYNRGVLFEVCSERENLEQRLSQEKEAEIKKLNESLEKAKTERSASKRELIAIYIYEFIVHFGQKYKNNRVDGAQFNGKYYTLEELSDEEIFNQFKAADQLIPCVQGHPVGTLRATFREIEARIVGSNFDERVKNIEARSGAKRAEIEHRIASLSSEIDEIKRLPFSTLLKDSKDLISTVIESPSGTVKPCEAKAKSVEQEARSKKYDLLRALLHQGFLDEHYSYLTSVFYDGELGEEEYVFLRSLRARTAPDPDLQLSKPQAVVQKMKLSEFDGENILNVSLFDALLSPTGTEKEKLRSSVDYLCRNFAITNQFVSDYLRVGEHRGELAKKLLDNWDIISSSISVESVDALVFLSIFKYCDAEKIANKIAPSYGLAGYIEAQIPYFEAGLSGDASRFKLYQVLGVESSNLYNISGYRELFDFVVGHKMYKISAQNIDCILTKFETEQSVSRDQISRSNLTTILASENDPLIEYVEENFALYFDQVLENAPKNCNEEPSAIFKVLCAENLSVAKRVEFAGKQAHVFSDFENVPDQLHEPLLQNGSVELTWSNFYHCWQGEISVEAQLVDLISKEENAYLLGEQSIAEASLDEEDKEELSCFILSLEGVSDETYARLVKAVKLRFKHFPDKLSVGKMRVLLSQNSIELSEQSLGQVKIDPDLGIKLLLNNQSNYLADHERFLVPDEVIIGFLKGVAPEKKFDVIKTLSVSTIEKDSELGSLACEILLEATDSFSSLDTDFIIAAFSNYKEPEKQVAYLTKVAGYLEAEELISLLRGMPVPYSEVADTGRRAKLKDTEENRKLLSALEERSVFSSFGDSQGNLRVYHPKTK